MSEIQIEGAIPYVIKDWDSAIMQFGLTDGNNIKTRGRYFRRHERHICGRTVFIDSNPKKNVYIVRDSVYTYRLYYVSIDMLEPLFIESSEELNSIKAQDFDKILGVTA